MTKNGYETMELDELTGRLDSTSPNNEDRHKGFALVNVLSREEYEKERIPGSTNIPQGEEGGFETRFDREKEIVVYCASRSCPASESVARELVRRGFRNVVDYEAGMAEWRDAGRPVAGSGVKGST